MKTTRKFLRFMLKICLAKTLLVIGIMALLDNADIFIDGVPNYILSSILFIMYLFVMFVIFLETETGEI